MSLNVCYFFITSIESVLAKGIFDAANLENKICYTDEMRNLTFYDADVCSGSTVLEILNFFILLTFIPF